MLAYSKAAARVNEHSSPQQADKAFVTDYLRTMTKIESERAKRREGSGLEEISRELIELPRNMIETIKISELVIKPEVFDGIKPRPRSWIQNYNDAIIANGWSDRVAIKYLPTFLIRSAKAWYFTEVKPYVNTESKWYQVYTLFAENYLGEGDRMDLMDAVENAKQRPGELVCNFIPRMRRLMLLLTPTLSEADQLRQLKSKLRPEYKQLIAFSDPKTIAQLRETCMKIEAGFPRNRYGDSRKLTTDGYPPRKNNERSSQKTTVANIKPNSSRNNQSRAGLVCYNCNKPGHLAKNCWAPKGKKTSPNETMQSITTGNSDTDDENEIRSEKPEGNANSDESETIEVLTIGSTTKRHTPRPKYFISEEPLNLVVGGGKLLRQKVVINDAEINAVVDTGAYVSVIDGTLVKHFNWTKLPSSKKLIGADGNPLESEGATVAKIAIKIGVSTKIIEHELEIVTNLTAPMLLGLELLRKLEVHIDVINLQLYYPRISGKITPITKEIIPARSLKVVEGTTEIAGVVMTVPYRLENGVLVANSISNVVDTKVPILLANPNQMPIVINENTVLGTAEEHRETAKHEIVKQGHNDVQLILPMEKLSESVIIGDNLNNAQITQLKLLLEENAEAFSFKGSIGVSQDHKHEIELLPGATPAAEPLRRRAPIQIEETRRQVRQLLDEGIIEESSSLWAAAYVLAKKKYGEFRLCIDFRKLNSLTKKSVYPLPNIDECLETLSGKKFFTQIDFKSGFWQIQMGEKSKELTAFKTEDGQFQFKRMPFGLTNAPALFQRMINSVLAGLKGMNLQVFIDDICIATKTWSEHLALLKETLKKVIQANLKIKADKCVFAANKVKFLGHEISEHGIKQDPDKLKALLKLPAPNDVKEVKRILGMLSYYRKFVKNFATLAEPLTTLTRKNVEFNWGESQKRAFKDLLGELKKNATLTHYDHSKPTLIKTDASRSGVAGMLLQKHEDDWKLITCCSRRLSTSEANYGITDLEGLAVVYTVTKLRPYLLGKSFKILVDHCALCVLNKRVPASARLRRWAIVLSEYDFEIIYTKGNLHCDIDCLSRAPVDDHVDPYLESQVYLVAPYDLNDWITSYSDDESKQLFQKAFDKEEGLKPVDNVIYKDDCLYVAPSRRHELIKGIHESNMNAHPGINAMISKLKENYWWPNMRNEVSDVINDCLTCKTQKPDRSKPAGNMFSFELYSPGEQIGVDLIEKITESHNGNQYIIVVVDMFSRLVDAKAVPDKGAPTFTQYLIEYCGRYGIPKRILTDQSTTFCNEFTQQIIKVFGASHIKATPYHSQGNSMVEKVNQTLEEKIRLILNAPHQDKNWDAALPMLN